MPRRQRPDDDLHLSHCIIPTHCHDFFIKSHCIASHPFSAPRQRYPAYPYRHPSTTLLYPLFSAISSPRHPTFAHPPYSHSLVVRHRRRRGFPPKVHSIFSLSLSLSRSGPNVKRTELCNMGFFFRLVLLVAVTPTVCIFPSVTITVILFLHALLLMTSSPFRLLYDSYYPHYACLSFSSCKDTRSEA